jgi:serine/threonine-protein kinase
MGLIHRDIKPKNLMITEDGTVKVADMGLARETTDMETAETEKGRAYGTPYYIAPEQIRGEVDIDGRADIYSLGATLYHMVTGRVPFMADDPADVMRKHLRERLVPPDHLNTNLSGGISEVIEIMMAKRREERYDSAEQLLEDFRALQRGEAPLQAHKRFDVSALEELEDGEEIELEEAGGEYEEALLAKYRVAVIVLGVLAVMLLLGLIISVAV